MNIETKIRNIRFLGELAKFKVASPGLIFSCLKVYLLSFKQVFRLCLVSQQCDCLLHISNWSTFYPG